MDAASDAERTSREDAMFRKVIKALWSQSETAMAQREAMCIGLIEVMSGLGANNVEERENIVEDSDDENLLDGLC